MKMNKEFISIVFIAVLTMTIGTAAASSSSSLDQCKNGGLGATPAPCNNLGTNSSWVNGNLNGQQAHYAEGQFIPYRIIFTGLTAGVHNVQIEYAVTKGTKHAIDYLGTFSFTETLAKGNNPCGDIISGCNPANPTSTIPITLAALNGFPTGSLNTFKGVEIPGVFSMWNGTLNNMVYVFQNVIDNGDFKTQVSINFTIPTGSNGVAVLSWGGHVASEADWGIGNSSSAITGSPYHMINVLLDGKSPGAQDRSLSTTAIAPTLTVFKFVDNDGSPNPLQPSAWTMNVSGCISNCSFPGSSSGTVVSLFSNYNTTETGPTNYIANFSSSCSGPFPGGGVSLTCNVTNTFNGLQNISITKTAFPITYNQTGQNITYTYTITDTGTTTLSGPFTVNDNQTGTISPCGNGPLSPGGNTSCTANYTIKLSDLINGSVTNAATVTNGTNGPTAGPVTTTVTANLAKLTVSKIVDNDNSPTPKNSSDWTMNVSGCLTNCSFPGNSSGTAVFLTGDYNVTETGPDNYTATFTADCSGPFPGTGNSKTCTVTNTYNKSATISLTKSAFPTIYNQTGQIITYTYTIKNTGNSILTQNFTVTDNQTGTISPCGTVPLNPGDSTSCTSTYTIKQSDLINGSVSNAATANSSEVTTTPPATTTVTANLAKLTVFKIVDNDNSPNPKNSSDWTINVSGCLENCSFPGSSSGTTVSLIDNYAVTESGPDNYTANLSSGCSGSFPGGGTFTTCNVTNTFNSSPEISLTKTAFPTTYNQTGQNITYTYTINNIGNTVLTQNFTVTDNQTGVISPCGTVPLNPGDSTSCTSIHTITQSDLDNGSVSNAATANSSEVPTTPPSNTTVNAQQFAHLNFIKSGALNITSGNVDYSINITNDGNVDLKDVNVTDPNIVLTCSQNAAPLAPQASMSCSGAYPASSPINTNTTIEFLAPPYTQFTTLVV